MKKFFGIINERVLAQLRPSLYFKHPFLIWDEKSLKNEWKLYFTKMQKPLTQINVFKCTFCVALFVSFAFVCIYTSTNERFVYFLFKQFMLAYFIYSHIFILRSWLLLYASDLFRLWQRAKYFLNRSVHRFKEK